MEQSQSTEKGMGIGLEDQSKLGGLYGLVAKLRGVEIRGIIPIPYEERTVTQYSNIFSLWFCMACNALPITTGMVGTLSFEMKLRDSSLVILFFTLLSNIPVAYLSTWGPRTGMRQLIQARFSFGKYFTCILILLNLATMTGFGIIAAIIGGQALSAVEQGNTINATVGIIIISLCALLLSFCGFKILHTYERYAWIPALIAIIIATGCGGKHLHEQVAAPSASAATVLSFGSLIAGYTLPWAALASDFSTYMNPKAPPFRIALYTYIGLALPTILLMILGAAIGAAVPNVPSWAEGNDTNAASGILAAMLEPAGGFGQLVTVVIAFSMVGNVAATMYSITLNFQMLLPWMIRIPRPVYSIVVTAITIGVGIKAATSFFHNLENFLGVVGYWAATFISIVIIEHAVFRKSRFNSYTEDATAWNDTKKLPPGIAAIGAAILSFSLVVPCMNQIWFEGPIAKNTGDIGFEVALALSSLLYMPLRLVEKKICGR